MLKVDRLCVYVLVFGLMTLIPSVVYIKFTDELCAAALGGIAVTDSIFNGKWKRYIPLWIIMGIMAFYALYSTIYIHSNSIAAIITDFIIELKPFVPMIVLLCIGPSFTNIDKQIIRAICWVNGIASAIVLAGGISLIKPILSNPAVGGCIIFGSAMFITYCSIDKYGRISRNTLFAVTALLVLGLLCAKSKYYGIFILSIYFIYIYKPGMTRHITVKHIVTVIALSATIIIATWSKIEYYFITGGVETTFDPSMRHSFARPVLYITMWNILWDYFPFGSGMASFATYASQKWYSNVYYEYGINHVHGLSPNAPDFICDAYYTSLAQFGIIGVILFICFWIYAYGFLRRLTREDGMKYPFIIGSLIICFMLIESIGGNTISQNTGITPFMLLGIICAKGKSISPIQDNGTTYNNTQLQKI